VLPLSGCELLIPPERAAALYQVRLDSLAGACVTVQATFTGLPVGALTLAGVDRWGAASNLAAQIRWLALEGQEPNALPQAAGTLVETASGLTVRPWQVQVPAGGKLELRYCVQPGGQDGPVPSALEAERALLLGRSLFVVPLAWLDEPHAEREGTLAVEIVPPQQGRMWASWQLDGTGRFRPTSVSDLLDAAVAAGAFGDYSVQADLATARVLVPSWVPAEQAEAMAKAVAQQAAAAQSLIGVSPTGDVVLDVLAIILPDRTEGAEGGAGQTGLPGGDVAGRATLLLRPSAEVTLASAAAQQAMRLWVGGRARMTERWSAQGPGQAAWFEVGWSSYLAWRAQLTQGGLPAVIYWDQMREAKRRLENDPYLAEMTLEDASRLAAERPELWPLVRDKALLAALLWDVQAMGGDAAVSLLARAVRNLTEQRASSDVGDLVTAAQVLEALRSVSGMDWAAAERELATATGPLNLSAVAELTLWPAGYARTLASAEGYTLVYQWMDGVSDEVAICLSGDPGRPPYDLMAALAPALDPLWDVAYLDQRGAGRSAVPGKGAYSLDALINDIELLRAELEVEQVTLIGHSWGGFQALEYARRYPERVAGLVLLAPVPSAPTLVAAGLRQLEDRAAMLPDASQADAARLIGEGVTTAEDLLLLGDLMGQAEAFGDDLAEVSRYLQERYAQYVQLSTLPAGLKLQNPEVLATIVARDQLLAYDLEANLPSLSVPTVIMVGERDRSLPLEALQRVADQIGGQLHVVPHAGHYLHVDACDAVGQAIARYVAAQR
jgi:proline iminopeptidase